MAVYEVKDLAGRVALVEAPSSTAAKRHVCRMRGIRPSDPLLGASILTARRIKEKEERAGCAR